MRSVFSTQDFNGDGRGDLFGVRPDGGLVGYYATATGLLGRGQVIGGGWGGFTALTSPGDLDRNGRSDVVARKPDGSLWVYLATVGRFAKGAASSVGYQGYTLIL
jgi:hypothetical protein